VTSLETNVSNYVTRTSNQLANAILDASNIISNRITNLDSNVSNYILKITSNTIFSPWKINTNFINYNNVQVYSNEIRLNNDNNYYLYYKFDNPTLLTYDSSENLKTLITNGIYQQNENKNTLFLTSGKYAYFASENWSNFNNITLSGWFKTSNFENDDKLLDFDANQIEQPFDLPNDIIPISIDLKGNYYIEFKNTTTYTITLKTNTYCDILIVAGGGGGGGILGGGGGGAGGVIYLQNFLLLSGTHTIIVGSGGAGGAAAPNATSTNGNNSSFDNFIAIGGGGGGAGAATTGYLGGSGGGAGSDGSGGQGTVGQGYNGGTGVGGNGGGGGGANQSSPTTNGTGGVGIQLSITGIPKYYAGGGGGGNNGESGYTGGQGGGGNGGSRYGGINGNNGANNTGGGGGGAGYAIPNYSKGGTGGSGIVIIRYNALIKKNILINKSTSNLSFKINNIPVYETPFNLNNNWTHIIWSIQNNISPLGYIRINYGYKYYFIIQSLSDLIYVNYLGSSSNIGFLYISEFKISTINIQETDKFLYYSYTKLIDNAYLENYIYDTNFENKIYNLELHSNYTVSTLNYLTKYPNKWENFNYYIQNSNIQIYFDNIRILSPLNNYYLRYEFILNKINLDSSGNNRNIVNTNAIYNYFNQRNTLLFNYSNIAILPSFDLNQFTNLTISTWLYTKTLPNYDNIMSFNTQTNVITKYPTITMTSSTTTSGGLTVKTKTSTSSSIAHYAFNNVTNNGDAWISNDMYDTYGVAVSTTYISDSNYKGEYIIIDTGISFYLKYFQFWIPNNRNGIPKNFILYASNDSNAYNNLTHSSWVFLKNFILDVNNLPAYTNWWILNCEQSVQYRVFGIVIKEIYRTDRDQNLNSISLSTTVRIYECQFYENIVKSTNISIENNSNSLIFKTNNNQIYSQQYSSNNWIYLYWNVLNQSSQGIIKINNNKVNVSKPTLSVGTYLSSTNILGAYTNTGNFYLSDFVIYTDTLTQDIEANLYQPYQNVITDTVLNITSNAISGSITTLDTNVSNYVTRTSNQLANAIINTSNTISNRVTSLETNVSNYVTRTSNQLANAILTTSNSMYDYLWQTSNNLINYIKTNPSFDGNYNSLTNKLTAGTGITITGNSIETKLNNGIAALNRGNYISVDANGYLIPRFEPLIIPYMKPLLSTIIIGALEFDGTVPYFSTSNFYRGVIPCNIYNTLSQSRTINNANTAQPIFTTNIILMASTTYEMEMIIYKTRIFTGGTAVAHNIGLSFTGTASLSIGYSAIYIRTTSPYLTGPVTSWINTKNNTNLASAAFTLTTGSTENIHITAKGIVRVTDAGTFVPNITYSAVPVSGTVTGYTDTLYPNSYIKLTPIGIDTGTTFGNTFV
jgi:hypothetical protein